MTYRAADAGADDGQNQYRRHPEVLASRCDSIACLGRASKDGHKRPWPSFETQRKRAAPLAITAKPLRGDDG
jgi:hypothetical protein